MTKSEAISSKRALTQEAFEALLNRLHADREQAGIRYETLRLKLIYFFEVRSCPAADSLADETINRLAHKLSEGEDIQKIDAFALTIARFIWLESHKKTPLLSFDELLTSQEFELALRQERGTSDEIEERLQLMRECLAELPPEKLALLRAYFQISGPNQAEQRHQLARQMGISENALYLQIHRTRQKLMITLALRLKKG